LRYLPGKPFHISLVELKGLDVHVPPKSHFALMLPLGCRKAATPGAVGVAAL
jgi:hypothetical protein